MSARAGGPFAGRPLRQVLRWDLALRWVLGLVGPGLLVHGLGGGLTPTVIAALSGGLGALSSLGPEFRHGAALVVTAVATPIAVLLGTAARGSTVLEMALVFVLFLVFGAMAQAGIGPRMCWFPVAALGLIAALTPWPLAPWAVAGLTLLGVVWAAVLALLVPALIHLPRLPMTPDGSPFGAGLRDWARRGPRALLFPALLATVAAVVVLVGIVVPGGIGHSALWAGFALLAVIQPTYDDTKDTMLPTVLGTAIGVTIAAALVVSRLPAGVVMAAVVLVSTGGMLLSLRSRLAQVALVTPLPVLAASLTADIWRADEVRVVDYVLGVVVALGVALIYQRADARLAARRPARSRGGSEGATAAS